MTNVNFFWRGNEFNFLEYIVIKSHIKVGHSPVIWLSEKKPKSKYWNSIEKQITIKNADDICNVSEFISGGGNLRTASSLWRWNLLYELGGIYCDTDAFALRKFPEDEWIVCSAKEDPQLLYTGVLKAPPHHDIFLDCISNTKKDWGNVKVFTDAYQKNFGKITSSHEGRLFYPYHWKECYKLLSNLEIPDDCYSIHFYTKALEDYLKKRPEGLIARVKQKIFPKSFKDIDEEWCKKNPETLLSRLWLWLDEKYGKMA